MKARLAWWLSLVTPIWAADNALHAASDLLAPGAAQRSNRATAAGGETWCGKAYKVGDPAVDPGGQFQEGLPWGRDMLDLRVAPRHSVYLSNDEWGGFLIDALISQTIGQQNYCNSLGNSALDIAAGIRLNMVIFREDTGQTVVERTDVTVNTTGTEAFFSLSDFAPKNEPYEIVVRTRVARCAVSYEARTKFWRLPAPKGNSSAVRIDNKFGGLAIANGPTNRPADWRAIFPYSFYVDWGNWLIGGPDRLESYAQQGYNIIHPVPGTGLTPWGDNFTMFDHFVEGGRETRDVYHVLRYRNRKSILTWYTADEPDGNADPLDATRKAYDLIKSLDPYRPVSLVLNCYDYHYKEYSAGADIILTDPYPVAVNATFSIVHNTICNSTYGDCGCDNCEGKLTDVSNRMERFKYYQHNLNVGPKVFWGVPQAFGGSEYWSRPPTGLEEAIMAMLFINHGAKGIVAWNYPTTDELRQVTSVLAKSLGGREAGDFLLFAKGQQLALSSSFDAAAWRLGKQILFSIIHLNPKPYARELTVGLGVNAIAMKMLWPPNDLNWFIGNKSISRAGMGGYEVNVFLLQTE